DFALVLTKKNVGGSPKGLNEHAVRRELIDNPFRVVGLAAVPRKRRGGRTLVEVSTLGEEPSLRLRHGQRLPDCARLGKASTSFTRVIAAFDARRSATSPPVRITRSSAYLVEAPSTPIVSTPRASATTLVRGSMSGGHASSHALAAPARCFDARS